MAKIAIDMDGTIADFTSSSFRKVGELYGIQMTKADAYKPKTAQLVWERMTGEQKAKYNNCNELYGEICASGFFESIEPFPGAIQAVKDIKGMGHEIFFLTKTLNWDRSAPEKAVWLNKYFPDMEYHIIMVDSVKSKHIINVDVVIDDDPRVLEGIVGFPICMAQPWNESFINEGKYLGEIVHDMDEAVDVLRDLAPVMQWWEENGL